MSERVAPRDVVDQQGASCASVVAPRDGLEGLLTSGVPDLQLDVLLVDLDCARTELDSNGQIVLLSESLVCKLE